MLLIAMPKSASTSLAATIAKIGNLNCKLGISRIDIDIDCDKFKYLQKCHDNMIERSSLFIKQVVEGRKTIFKEHLLPTKRHLEILKKFKSNIVILLRNPLDSYDSYKRLKVKNCEKLEKELKDFHNKYMWFASNKKNIIIIYYEDLILNYKNVMSKILKHFKIKGKIIPMLKLKYTGVGRKRLEEKKDGS